MIYDYKGNPLGNAPFGYSWAGKTMSVNGESHVNNPTTNFYGYMEEQLGVSVARLGISGVPVAPSDPGWEHDFRRRVSDIPANVDLIFMIGDTNAVGVTDQDHLDSTDITTWGGRWNVTIDAIKRSFPQVPVLLLSDYPHAGAEKQTVDAYVQFNHMAVKHGCYFLSGGRDGGFSRVYASRVWGLYDKDTSGHCSHEAMKIWADCVLQKVRSIRPPIWSGVDTISVDETATVSVNGTTEIGYDITGDQSIRWTSSNENVACVMGGVVYGMSAGTATILATTRNGNTASCVVTVSASG